METKDKFYVWLVWLAAIRRGGGALPFLQASLTPLQGSVIVDIRKLCFTADQVLMAPPHLPFCILRRTLKFPELLYVHTRFLWLC